MIFVKESETSLITDVSVSMSFPFIKASTDCLKQVSAFVLACCSSILRSPSPLLKALPWANKVVSLAAVSVLSIVLPPPISSRIVDAFAANAQLYKLFNTRSFRLMLLTRRLSLISEKVAMARITTATVLKTGDHVTRNSMMNLETKYSLVAVIHIVKPIMTRQYNKVIRQCLPSQSINMTLSYDSNDKNCSQPKELRQSRILLDPPSKNR